MYPRARVNRQAYWQAGTGSVAKSALMQERGYAVDHSTVQRWVVHYASRIEKAFRRNKKRVGNRWQMDWSGIPETYIKIRGEWKYLYRAVDKQGQTIDFLLTTKRDKKAARRFLDKAIGSNGKPRLINIDKGGGFCDGVNSNASSLFASVDYGKNFMKSLFSVLLFVISLPAWAASPRGIRHLVQQCRTP